MAALRLTLGVRAIAARGMAESLSTCYRIHAPGWVGHALTCSTFEFKCPAASGSDKPPVRALLDMSARRER
jgi:hypothetical protein